LIIKHSFSKRAETIGIASLEKDSQRTKDYTARAAEEATVMAVLPEKQE